MFTINEIKYFQKQRETLHTAGKIRYMMEVLEEKGRPHHINERVWKFQNTREDRWNIIFAIPSHELHSWLRTFLDCLRGCCAGKTKNQILNESQDIVKIIFDITDKKIHTYFQDTPVDMSVFKSSKIKRAIDCLNNLEPEIMAYHSVSTYTSSSTWGFGCNIVFFFFMLKKSPFISYFAIFFFFCSIYLVYDHSHEYKTWLFI